MRWTSWCVAVLAVVVFGLPHLHARDDKPAAKKDSKKDEEVKGKIPDAIKKTIEKDKIQFGIVLVGVTAGGPATNGREKPKGEGDVIILEEGDIITHIDGKEVRTAADYYKLMGGNDEKKVTVIDVNTGKPVTDYFKPKDGQLEIKFEVVTPPLG